MTTERLWRPPAGALPPATDFAVTTRRGGASAGPFATLNVGLVPGEREEAVAENRRRVRADFGAGEREPFRVHQVHGDRIVPARSAGDAPGLRADGLLLDGPRRDATTPGDARIPCVAVSVADCAPVAIVAEGAPLAALLHCGWRGTVAGIVPRAVSLLEARGARARALRAVVGPCIHPCCYPVGPDVAARFPTIHLVPHASGRHALDLPGAIVATLRAAGVPASRITVAGECTSCRSDLFFSHRRDRGVTGRHWALLRLGRAPA
ncbi:MAG: polyphenol oxidase family protein [Hyphomicrobiales bacterium]